MFCIKCGKAAVTGNFCKECFLEREALFDVMDFRLTRCPICGSFYQSTNKIELSDAIKKCIKTSHKITGTKISYRNKGNHIFANVECSGVIKPFKKAEKRTVDIIVDTKQCDSCTKLSGHYYESIMQIRGSNKEEIFAEVQKAGFLSYNKKVDNGYDVRFVNKKDAAKLANMLKHLTIKRTAKLVGEKEGKKVYRVSYSIR